MITRKQDTVLYYTTFQYGGGAVCDFFDTNPPTKGACKIKERLYQMQTTKEEGIFNIYPLDSKSLSLTSI